MLLWLDLETTGLEPSVGRILEVAAVVTNDNLEEQWKGEWVVHQKRAEVTPLMDAYVTNMHTKNGLLDAIGEPGAVFLSQVEADLVQMVPKWFGDNKPILCGSSIHFDRKWLVKWLPHFEQLLHYRMGDASGSHELARRLTGLQLSKPDVAHRALADVRASIELARQVFVVPQSTKYEPQIGGLSLLALVGQAHTTAREKGFWDVPRVMLAEDKDAKVCQKLALIHSEVSEAVEAIRQADPTKNNLSEELADIVIRVADLAGYLQVDLEHEVTMKLAKNSARPNKHSKRF